MLVAEVILVFWIIKVKDSPMKLGGIGLFIVQIIVGLYVLKHCTDLKGHEMAAYHPPPRSLFDRIYGSD